MPNPELKTLAHFKILGFPAFELQDFDWPNS